MRGCTAVVFCVVAVTAWAATAGETNTHNLALQHMLQCGFLDLGHGTFAQS